MDEETYGDLIKSFIDYSTYWEEFALTAEPQTEKLPAGWEEKLDRFQRLLILKIWRPEKLLLSCYEYVKHELGQYYIENAAVSMQEIYDDADKITPVIYVLSQGADPTSFLMKFAKEKEFDSKLNVISLGQG